MRKIIIISFLFFSVFAGYAQQFEEPKVESESFTKVKVEVGGDFAIQYQALDHEANNPGYPLIALGSNLNLPTANFNLNTLLAPGIKVNLETYLSSRHHNEAWVKGGYLLIDKMPFLPASDKLMEYLTIKAGVMHPNVGDHHFRRSDNGSVLRNTFVGNYILDDYSTNTGVEVMFRNNGWLLMGGVNNGTLNPALATTKGTGEGKEYIERNMVEELAFVWKASYDKQISEVFRLRATLSGSHQGETISGSLHSGDRTGSRYYFVMNRQAGDGSEFDVSKNFTSGNFSPGSFTKDNTLVANLLLKYSGLELFGTFEKAKGITTRAVDYDFVQFAMEAIYRMGKQQQWFLGARYNTVANKETSPQMQVSRVQFAGGWFMTKNVVMKLEYVDQKYENFTATYGDKAGFSGFMLEAGISF